MFDKKTSKTSFIVAVIMLVVAVILIIAGIAENSPRIVRESFGGYHSMMISYCSSNCQLGFVLVQLGGFLLLGGILLLILSAVISANCKNDTEKKEENSQEQKTNPEDDPRYY